MIAWGKDLDETLTGTLCHGCDAELTSANTAASDTCTDCLAMCGCWVCEELRWTIAEDRAAQMAYDMQRERA